MGKYVLDIIFCSSEEDVLDIGLVEEDVDPELQFSAAVYAEVIFFHLIEFSVRLTLKFIIIFCSI